MAKLDDAKFIIRATERFGMNRGRLHAACRVVTAMGILDGEYADQTAVDADSATEVALTDDTALELYQAAGERDWPRP